LFPAYGVREMPGRIARARRVGGFVLALLCVAPGVSAKVLVEGDETSVSLVAENANMADVLAALKAKFRFRYSLSADPDRQVTVNLSGPLHQVVARLLDGYDFVVKRSPEGVELLRMAPRGTATAAPQARPGVTVWQSPAAQARAESLRSAQ